MPRKRDLRLLVGAVGLSSLGDRVALVPLALLVEQRGDSALAVPALWPVVWLALAGYLFGGVAHGVKNVLARTLIHERAPERLHGRAFAAFNGLRNGAELVALTLGGIAISALDAALRGRGPGDRGVCGAGVDAGAGAGRRRAGACSGVNGVAGERQRRLGREWVFGRVGQDSAGCAEFVGTIATNTAHPASRAAAAARTLLVNAPLLLSSADG